MDIGIDATPCFNRRGYGRVALGLLGALSRTPGGHRYVCFADGHSLDRHSLPEGLEVRRVSTGRAAVDSARASGHRSVKDVLSFMRAVRRERFDAFFFPASTYFFPIVNRTRKVVVIYDVTPERHPELCFPNRSSAAMWKLKSLLIRRQADLVVTFSEYARRSICERYPSYERRIRLLPMGLGREFRPIALSREARAELCHRYGLPADRPIILYMGGLSPHKNLRTLLTAYELMCRGKGTDAVLALCGEHELDPFHSEYEVLRQRVAESRELSAGVVFTGYVAEEDLPGVYAVATLLVLPSLDEGFGLTALEAMACGVPALVSRAGALPETTDGAAVLVDASRPEELAEGMSRMLSDEHLRVQLREAGLKRAAGLSWDRSAEQLIALLEELVGCGRPPT